jgi:hypothetical protein
MALFGKSRDINLFHTINSELLKDIIQTEAAYYKFALNQTVANVYGEAMGKNYYEPMKIACLISRQDQAWSSDDFGSDVGQTVDFRFLKYELETINLIPEIGDIILYRNNFYEIDSKIENQLFMGQDPNYALSMETTEHGGSFSVLVSAHLSRVEKLNLIPLREGKYPTTTKVDGGLNNQVGRI